MTILGSRQVVYYARGAIYAIALVALAAVTSRSLGPVSQPLLSPYFIAVMLAAIYGGLASGLLSTFLAAFGLAYFEFGTSGGFALGPDDGERLLAFIVVAVVISSVSAARRKAEQQVRAAMEQLAAADRAKDEFLATLSHELRTPLTSILGWSRVLQSDPDADTRAEAIRSIEQSARAQARLVEELLDISKIVLQKFALDCRQLILQEVVQEAVDMIRPEAQSRDVTLSLQMNPVPIVLDGDEHRLKQVVGNLLSNAVKFTPEGGLVRIELGCTNNEARLAVLDNGEGIDPELLPELFTRFKQGSDAYRKGGMGLGLALVRHIVELHGGRVTASSRGNGSGSVFQVLIPVERPEHQGSPSRPS